MFCIQKRVTIWVFFALIVISGVIASRVLLSSNLSYKSKANEVKTACQKVGKYDILPFNGVGVTPAIVQYYYDNYCKKNENTPIWNRAYGENARCYTATLVCGNSSGCSTGVECFSNVSNQTRCLYEAVDFKKCTDAKVAPLIADPSTPAPWGRCTGPCESGTALGACVPNYALRCECNGMLAMHKPAADCAPAVATCTGTCDGGIAVGSCLPGYGKKCVCEGTLPRYRDDATCKAQLPVVAQSCYYGGNPLTTTSTPYYLASNNCIVDSTTRKYIGYICVTENGQTKSVQDREKKCVNAIVPAATAEFVVPATTCGAKHEQLMKDKTECKFGSGPNDHIAYGTCTGGYICRCDDTGKYTYPTLVNSPAECK